MPALPRPDLLWFFQWRGRGFPVRHRPSGRTFYLPSVTERVVEKNCDMVVVSDQPDGCNNQLARQIMLLAFPTNHLEVDE
jgi:hypothetical protein